MRQKRYPLGRPFFLLEATFAQAAGRPPRSAALLREYAVTQEYATRVLADGLRYEASKQVERAEIEFGLENLIGNLPESLLRDAIEGAQPGDPRWPHQVRSVLTEHVIRNSRPQIGWRGRSAHRWTFFLAFVVGEHYRTNADGSAAVQAYLRDVAGGALADLKAGLSPRPPVKQWVSRINRAVRRALSIAE